MMTTATTLMGLAPLVFIPGAGTELYRGLGAIVLFGLASSTLITLVFLPSFLITVLKIGDSFRRSPKTSV
jgi:multidrug efflux pump subunit AcrB